MKKILIVLLVIFGCINLSSCSDQEDIKNDLGDLIDNVMISLKDGSKLEVNLNTDPIEIYNTIMNNYIKETAYQLSGKINRIGDEIYNQEINGFYYLNSSSNIDYLETINNDLDLHVYYYSKGSNEMLNLVKQKNAPLYGGASMNGNLLRFKNKDTIVDITYPPMNDVTDSKTETICKYLINVDRIRRIISLGILSGFYFEDYIENFNYSVSLTNKYIILTVDQPFGESEFPLAGKDQAILRKGQVTKKIHFNINTFEIDYIESNVQTYLGPIYYGLLYEYSYTLSKVDSKSIVKSISDLLEYTNSNTVLK